MSLGQVALGLASLAMGVHHLRTGAKRLTAAASGGSLGGSAAQEILRRPLVSRDLAMPGKPFMDSGRRSAPTRQGNVPMRMRSFNIRTLDDRIRYLSKLVDEGKRDPAVYAFARRAVTGKCGNGWCVPEKDNVAEARTLFGALRRQAPPQMTARDVVTARKYFKNLRKNVRYTSDIYGVDTYQKPGHTLGLRSGDCVPEGSLLLRDNGFMVPIERIQEGDTIFDGSGWAKVTKWWDKGVQPVRALVLNNGCVLRCTDGHQLFVISGSDSKTAASVGTQEVEAKYVQPGDDLLQPREMVFREGKELDPDAAFLLGAYLAEGSERHRRVDGTLATVAIAGIPKAKGVRERIIEIAPRLGLRAGEQKREVYLSDSGDILDDLLMGCGATAPKKALPHVCWSPTTAEHILEGLNADGGFTNSGTFVFSTTSPRLAVQYRVLQRLQGKSCHIKRVDDHGGLGTHPLYRVTVRQHNHRRPWAKVRSISQAEETHVYDIETDSHRFYLPEQDIIVHNCDDYSSLTCAGLSSLGIPCRFKVIRTKGAKEWNHIFAQAGFPRANPQRWISMDSSVNMPFGWQAPPRMVAASRVFRVG